MRRRSLLRATFLLTLCGCFSPAFAQSNLWFTSGKQLYRLEAGTALVAYPVEFQQQPRLLLPSYRALRAIEGRRLVSIGDTHTDILLTLDFAPKGARSSADGRQVWVWGEHRVVAVDGVTGNILGGWRAEDDIEAAAMALNGSLWILTEHRIIRLNPLGQVEHAIPHRIEGDLVGLCLDELGGSLWAGTKHALFRWVLADLSSPPRRYGQGKDEAATEARDSGEDAEHEKPLRGLAVHPVFGTVWALRDSSLSIMSRDGERLATVNLRDMALEKARHIAFDPQDFTLWVAGKHTLLNLTSAGEFLRILSAPRDVDRIAAIPFELRPSIAIASPAEGSVIANTQPDIRIAVGSLCNRVPCLMQESYYTGLSLEVLLDGISPGNSFSFENATAVFRPTIPLAQGEHAIEAAAVDIYGNRSAAATSRFQVDTVPPSFLRIEPADGSTVDGSIVAIRGLVDDASATVVLQSEAAGFIAAGGASFDFAAELVSGANRFSLTARDAAGNTRMASLVIYFNPFEVSIETPTPGAVVDAGTAIVSGAFTGPSHAGVVVNGQAAHVLGQRFLAVVDLAPGTQTIQVVATWLPAGRASAEVTVAVRPTETANVTVQALPRGGVAPLPVTFSADGGGAIEYMQIDIDGDGGAEAVSFGEPIPYTFSAPGLYAVRAVVGLSSGERLAQMLPIIVADGAETDARFRALWGGFNEALVRGDLPGALARLDQGAQERYEPVLRVLLPEMSRIVGSYSAPQRVSYGEDTAEYAVVRERDGEPHIYFIYFIRDFDGIWRIDSM